MAEFRQLYAPPGMSSNFLAMHLLWGGETQRREIGDNSWVGTPTNAISHGFDLFVNDNTNEYHVPREKSMIALRSMHNDTLADKHPKGFEIGDAWRQGKKEMMLELLENYIQKVNNKEIEVNVPQHLMNLEAFEKFSDNLWLTMPFKDNSMILYQWLCLKDRNADAFVKSCMTMYFKVHEIENEDSFVIAHDHPLKEVPTMRLPSNFKTLAIDADDRTVELVKSMLRHKKGMAGEVDIHVYALPTIELSDQKVCYGKLFFDNDEDEIKRLFVFFKKSQYFENNKEMILKSFREYHKRNTEL